MNYTRLNILKKDIGVRILLNINIIYKKMFLILNI